MVFTFLILDQDRDGLITA